jgi:hypothetical protein
LTSTRRPPPPQQLYTTVPFASVVVFFALYLGIVNNQAYSRFVRFNGQVRSCLAITFCAFRVRVLSLLPLCPCSKPSCWMCCSSCRRSLRTCSACPPAASA